MGLLTLSYLNFRNLSGGELSLSPGTNLIWGPNGAGKTSLLEAIHFLAQARSFRTARADNLIADGMNELLVQGWIETGQGRRRSLGIRRSARTQEIHVGGRPVRRLSELVRQLPVRVIDQHSHVLLEGGPRERRRFLDWGVFHVEPAFLDFWQRYLRALRQRNAALRARAPVHELRLWHDELARTGESINALRLTHLTAIAEAFSALLADTTDLPEISLTLAPGWPADLDLTTALEQGLEADRQRGTTRYGPHRADLQVRVGPHRATERLSRGQQKETAAALILAQTRTFHRQTGERCVLLVDDLAAELDPVRRRRLAERLGWAEGQLFVTAIEPATLQALDWVEPRAFHVERGCVKEVLYCAG